MKKFFAIASLTFFICAGARAVDMALIYENEAAVTAGHSSPALVVDGGAAVPAVGTLGVLNTILYGDSDGLFRGQLARLDNELNLALIRRGERVGDATLQAAHAKQWLASATFLNVATAPAVAGAPGVVTIAPTTGDQPFLLKIDDSLPSDKPIVLKERFNKAKFTLSVVNTSTAPIWAIQVRLTSDPQLSFWKDGRHGGLNDVPTKEFTYTHQAVFNQMKPGAGFSVPVEVYFIKEHDYIWNFKITAKGVSYEKKVLVRFE